MDPVHRMLALLLSALVLPMGAMAADGASSLHAEAIAAGSKVGGAPDAAVLAAAHAAPASALAWVAGAPLVVCTALLWIGLFVRLRTRRPSEREAHAAAFAAAAQASSSATAATATAATATAAAAAAALLGVSWGSVVGRREWWRFGTALAVHVDLFHLLVDMWALLAIGGVERSRGSLFVGSRSAVLLAAVVLVRLRVWAMARKAGGGRLGGVPLHWDAGLAAQRHTVGATGLLLGWSMIAGASAPALPVLSLVMVQVLVRDASPVDATAGLIAGWLVAQGAFDWLLLSWYWALWFGAALALAAVVSVAATTQWRVPGVEVHDSFRRYQQDEPVEDLLWDRRAAAPVQAQAQAAPPPGLPLPPAAVVAGDDIV
jgi:hypothetical protein